MTINYKAKYLVSNSQTVLKDKVVQIQEGKISDVIDEKDLEKGSQIEDLGNVAIVPGFVNAHSHVGLVSVKGCLLYTSPSPRDKRQSRMPSSA